MNRWAWWDQVGQLLSIRDWTPYQTRNDKWAISLLRGLRGGVGVECGAWKTGPMTAVLSKHFNWRCLLIDANERVVKALRIHRPNDIVEQTLILESVRREVFLAKEKPGYSGVGVAEGGAGGRIIGRDLLRSDTLSGLLEKHELETIHYLCLDMEGAELAALRGLDFSRWSPWLITVEAPVRSQPPVLSFLADFGYEEIGNPFTRVDYELFFARTDLENLLEAVA